MSDISYKWIPTTANCYNSIQFYHGEELRPFGTFTSSEGCEYSAKPRIMTEWGFKDSDAPLIKIVMTKKNKGQKDWDRKYFIAIVEISDA